MSTFQFLCKLRIPFLSNIAGVPTMADLENFQLGIFQDTIVQVFLWSVVCDDDVIGKLGVSKIFPVEMYDYFRLQYNTRTQGSCKIARVHLKLHRVNY